MALPTTLDKSVPAGSESTALGDDRIRALTLAIEDLFGVPDATAIAQAFLDCTSSGLRGVVFIDATTSPTTTGHLRRNGTRLEFYDGTKARKIGGSELMFSSIAASSAISNTTAATAFSVSFSLPANTLAVGSLVEMATAGIYSTTATPTLALAARAGGVTIGTVTTTTATVTTRHWKTRASFVCRSTGASGTMAVLETEVGLSGSGLSDNAASNTPTFTLDTTTANTLDFTATWSAASTSNTITMHGMIVKHHLTGSTT